MCDSTACSGVFEHLPCPWHFAYDLYVAPSGSRKPLNVLYCVIHIPGSKHAMVWHLLPTGKDLVTTSYQVAVLINCWWLWKLLQPCREKRERRNINQELWRVCLAVSVGNLTSGNLSSGIPPYPSYQYLLCARLRANSICKYLMHSLDMLMQQRQKSLPLKEEEIACRRAAAAGLSPSAVVQGSIRLSDPGIFIADKLPMHCYFGNYA